MLTLQATVTVKPDTLPDCTLAEADVFPAFFGRISHSIVFDHITADQIGRPGTVHGENSIPGEIADKFIMISYPPQIVIDVRVTQLVTVADQG